MAHNTRKLVGVILMLSLLVAALAAFTITASAATEVTETISFANTNQRDSQTNSEQVWSGDNIKFTNKKASSSTNVGNYSNPVRIYASSSITFEAPGNIIKIEVTCSSATYATALKNSVTSGGTASVSSTKVTITPSSSSKTFEIAKISAQTRFNSLSITYAGSDCTHGNTTTSTEAATCTEDGQTTVVCNDCGSTVSVTPISALGHNYVDGFCSVCKEEQPADLSGRYYIAAKRTSGNYWYMTNNLGTASTKRYQAVDSGLAVLPTAINAPEIANVFVLEANGDGTYLIYAEGVTTNNYLGWTSGNSGTLVAKSSAKKFTIKELDSGLFNIFFDSRYLSLNGTSPNNYFAMYEGTQKQDLALIPVKEACQHEYTYTCDKVCALCGEITNEDAEHTIAHVEAVNAKCTENGNIEYWYCEICGYAWADEALTQQTNLMNVIVPSTGHSYDTAEVVVVENVPLVSYKCACGDEKVKNVATFKGASIRYKDGATVEQLAVRFGYQFDPNVIEYIVGWSWDYEAIDGNAVISGTVDGTAITAAGVSNLVFTDIPTKRIDGTFKVTLTLVLEIDGTQCTYTEAEANVRVISEVLAAIAGDTDETQEARDYAQDVLDAFEALPDDDEPAVMPSNEENEN